LTRSDDHRAFVAGVLGDLAERLLRGPLDDVDARSARPRPEFQTFESPSRRDRVDAAGPETMPSCPRARACIAVLDASLLLFSSVSVAAPTLIRRRLDQLGQGAPAISRGRNPTCLFDLAADGGDAAWMSAALPALDDRGVVLVNGDLLDLPQILELDVLEPDPRSSLITFHRSDGMSSSIALRRRRKPGALTAPHLQRAAQLVDDQRRQAFPSTSPRRSAAAAQLGHLLEQRQQIFHRS